MRHHASMRITVGNLKGGTAKTTSAVYLALGLSRDGRTLLVDADPQGSAMSWTQHAASWPGDVVVIPWATRDLAQRVRDVDGDYAHIVIDTGPQHDHIMRQALLATDHLLVPIAPSPMDVDRLPETFDLAAEIDAISPVTAWVMLAKVRTGTRSATEAREHLDGKELPVMDAQTRLLEEYLLAWGSVPGELGDYDAVLAELADGGRDGDG